MLTRSLILPLMLGAAEWAGAASLTSVAGAVGGLGNGSISGGCTTYGPPATTQAFFGSDGFGVPSGGIAACDYRGEVVEHSAAIGNVTSSASVSNAVLTLGASPAVYNGSGAARASYTSLGVQAHGAITGGELPGNPTDVYNSIGAAITHDTLTVNDPTRTGHTGYIDYVYTVDGSLSAPGDPGAYLFGYAAINFGVEQDGVIYSRAFQGHVYRGQEAEVRNLSTDAPGFAIGIGSASGSETFSTSDIFAARAFSFTFGTSFDYGIGLEAIAYGTADVDFSSTVKLVGINVYDSDGNLLSGYTISSDSGTNYLAAAVPEPHEWILLGVGGLGLAWTRRRKSGAALPGAIA